MADRWTAADYQALHDQLERECADLRAVVNLEVDRALFGMVPYKYRVSHAELEARRQLRPLPADHPLSQYQPWRAFELTNDPFFRTGGRRE